MPIFFTERRYNFAHPSSAGFLKIRRWQMSAVAVKNLQRVHASGDLHLQIRGDGGGQFFHQFGKSFFVGLEQRFCLCEFFGAAALHHERRERPRRTAETDERGLFTEFLAQNFQRGGDVI